MDELARKLIDIDNTTPGGTEVATAIFGTAGQLSRSLDNRKRFRIGMWPLRNTDDPELAMGVMTVLAYLLERWQDVKVYRLFARLEGTPDAYQWSIDKSQFDVEDWELEPLDENAALWGEIAKNDDGWTLSLGMEDDLTDEDEEYSFTYTAESIPALLNKLPDVSVAIAEKLDAGSPVIVAYQPTEANLETLKPLLSGLFDWQVRLLLSLWGKPFEASELEDAINKLVDDAKKLGDSFAAWSVTSALAHAMLPGYGKITEEVTEFADSIVASFPDQSFPPIYISDALYSLGRSQKAFDMMQSEVTAHPESVSSWLTLADQYTRSGRYMEAFRTYQRGIEAEAANVLTYTRYAASLMVLDQVDSRPNTFLYLEEGTRDDRAVLREAVEAYTKALEITETNKARILQAQTQLLMDLGEEQRALANFSQLVDLDETGDLVRALVDVFYNLRNPEPGLEKLEAAVAAQPERIDLLINLAVAYMNSDDEDRAIETLEKAEEMTKDDDILADIERLMLMAEDPEFEARLGEIAAQVDAGTNIRAEEADWLEEIIETAPSVGEAYVLLGRIYAAWDESQDALDTLLDGHEQLPEDPDIIEHLSRLLWEADQNDLAFDYLNKGIKANPRHVPLLTLTGLFLFEDGQEDAAKTFLTHAEAINPRHPALREAKRQISEIINARS